MKNIAFTNKKGFTLIELLVVIAIIGLLSTVTVYAINIARIKAREAKRKADTKQLELALNLYHDNNGRYPTDGYTETNYFNRGPDGLVNYLAPYMSNVPNDPLWKTTSSGYFYFTIRPTADWINTNGAWSGLTMDCLGKYVLVVRLMETSGPHRQDCALTRSNALSIVFSD
jgi:type II secretion system protein G